MAESIVFLNGRLMPERDAHISIWDRGFTLGDAVFDAMRTFRHQAFHLRDHLIRLCRSLRYVHIDPALTLAEMEGAVQETLEANLHLVEQDDDLSLAVRVSRGAPGSGPTVLITCRPLDFARFASLYVPGLELVTPTVRAIPADTMDPRVKTQSRIVHVLAEIQADAARRGAWPLLCNGLGTITESARANFFVVQGGTLRTPKGGRALAGVTAAVTSQLAEGLGHRVEERDLTPYDVLQADEAFLTATSFCLLPVQSLNGAGIGGPVPGPVTSRLMQAWRESTGVDFVAQALRFRQRA